MPRAKNLLPQTSRPYFGEMPLLLVLLTAGQSFAPSSGSSASGFINNVVFARTQSVDDVLFTEDVVADVAARSRIECSKQCVQTRGCVMCTFHHSAQASPGGSGGECRMFGKKHTAIQEGQKAAPGAMSFVRLPCPPGYVQRCGRCLHAVKRDLVYTAAQQQCRATDGGRLVMPRTAWAVGCVLQFMIENGMMVSFVGADDLEDPGLFRWNDGTALPDDSPLWDKAAGEPEKPYPGNNCVRMYYRRQKVFDGSCQDRRQSICEKDPVL
ncbi:uncharacterized protein LOC143289612 [Babylonia areolata]|uniref:uncharacterized protein LOC143289612 n=1 Tax=Babylonia areolata TaxID=304850 RepID=UPI003FD6B1AC